MAPEQTLLQFTAVRDDPCLRFGEATVTLQLGDKRPTFLSTKGEQTRPFKVAVSQSHEMDPGGQQRLQPLQQFGRQVDLRLVRDVLLAGVGPRVPTLARQRQADAAGQDQQPEQERVRLGARPASLVLFLLLVAAHVLNLGQAATLGVSAVKDHHPIPCGIHTRCHLQHLPEAMFVPLIHREPHPRQPATNRAGANPVDQRRLTQRLQRPPLDCQEQTVQQNRQHDAGPNANAIRSRQEPARKPLDGWSNRSDNHGAPAWAREIHFVVQDSLCTSGAFYFGTRKSAMVLDASQSAASPLVARKRRNTLLVLLGLALILVSVAVIAVTWWRRALAPVRSDQWLPALASPYRNVLPEVKYVGDDACAECHQSHAESYRRHPMGRSLAPVSQSIPLERFDQAAHNPFEALGFQFLAERRPGEMVHKGIRRVLEGRAVSEVDAEIQFVLGSGTRGRSYLFNRGGYLFQSPA